MTILTSRARKSGPQRLVNLLARLGPTATKIGEYLALRPDLLPQQYCDELLKLVDRGPPFTWPEVRSILVEELGHEPTMLFARIDPRPIAVGSLAQVHRARLKSGAEVAVKVQRPGIHGAVAGDVRRLQRFGRLIERSGIRLPVSVREVVGELSGWLRQEIDFTQELANVRRLRSQVAGSSIQVVPRAYARLSTARVITYEYLEGVSVRTVLRELRGVGDTQLGTPLLTDSARRRFAANLVAACLVQIFEGQFFHADVHPGNLLVLPDERVGFVDFGLCASLDNTLRANQIRYVAAVYDRDQLGMLKALTEILTARPESDVEGLRRDFLAETRDVAGMPAQDGEAEGRSTARYLIGVLRAARQNHFEVPPGMLSLYRVILTVETIADKFGFQDALREVGRDFFAKLQSRELVSQLLDHERLRQILVSALALTRDGPTQVAQLLADLAEGSLRIKVEVSDSARVVRAQNRRARLWTAAILSVSVAALLTIPGLPMIFGIPSAWVLSTMLAGLYLWCIFLMRNL